MVKKSATITPDVINGEGINGEKTCFIISPFGKKGSPDYIYFLQVRKYIIDAVVKEKGYKTTRADDIEAPGKITTQIINYLRDSDLVIADLSESNANVFYELAIRDAVRKPVILIRNSDFETPFDVRDQRYLKYSLDLDEIEESKKKLAGYIDAIENPTFEIISPVTIALIKLGDEISASIQDILQLILKHVRSRPREPQITPEEWVRLVTQPRGLGMGARARMMAAIINPNRGPIGTEALITAINFTSGSKVEIFFDYIETQNLLNTTTAKADGTIVCKIVIPHGLMGMHEIWIHEKATEHSFSVPFEVL